MSAHGPDDFESPSIGIVMPPSREPIDYRTLSAVIQHLPRDRRWSADRRARWLRAMEAAVDLLIDTVPEAAP